MVTTSVIGSNACPCASFFYVYTAKVSVVTEVIRDRLVQSEIAIVISAAKGGDDQLGIARDVVSCPLLRLKALARRTAAAQTWQVEAFVASSSQACRPARAKRPALLAPRSQLTGHGHLPVGARAELNCHVMVTSRLL